MKCENCGHELTPLGFHKWTDAVIGYWGQVNCPNCSCQSPKEKKEGEKEK